MDSRLEDSVRLLMRRIVFFRITYNTLVEGKRPLKVSHVVCGSGGLLITPDLIPGNILVPPYALVGDLMYIGVTSSLPVRQLEINSYNYLILWLLLEESIIVCAVVAPDTVVQDLPV